MYTHVTQNCKSSRKHSQHSQYSRAWRIVDQCLPASQITCRLGVPSAPVSGQHEQAYSLYRRTQNERHSVSIPCTWMKDFYWHVTGGSVILCRIIKQNLQSYSIEIEFATVLHHKIYIYMLLFRPVLWVKPGRFPPYTIIWNVIVRVVLSYVQIIICISNSLCIRFILTFLIQEPWHLSAPIFAEAAVSKM